MNDIIEKLKCPGLSGNESKVYYELLKRGPISVNNFAKKLDMDRTMVYQLLNNLIRKGLASYIIQERKKYFSASSPENLLTNLKEQEAIVNSIIVELKNIEKINETKQEINIYNGKRGLRLLFEEVMKTKNVCIIGATGNSFEFLKFEFPSLFKKAIKSGINGRMIANEKFKNHEMFGFSKLIIKFLKKIESQSTTTIYGDKVAINVSLDNPLVIIIENKLIADDYRNYFEILWKSAYKN